MIDWALFLTGAAVGAVITKGLFDMGWLKAERRRSSANRCGDRTLKACADAAERRVQALEAYMQHQGECESIVGRWENDDADALLPQRFVEAVRCQCTCGLAALTAADPATTQA